MEEREEMSEIRRMLEDLRNASIGFENYKRYFDQIKSTDSVMNTQINNRMDEYNELNERYNIAVDKDSFRQMADDGYITREVFELARRMNKNSKEALTWKSLQEEMYSVIFKKIYAVLDDARALEIKRDALKEMREMDTERNNLHLEQTKEAMRAVSDMNTKFYSFIKANDEEHRQDMNVLFSSLKDMVSMLNLELERKQAFLSGFEEKVDLLVSKEERITEMEKLAEKRAKIKNRRLEKDKEFEKEVEEYKALKARQEADKSNADIYRAKEGKESNDEEDE